MDAKVPKNLGKKPSLVLDSWDFGHIQVGNADKNRDFSLAQNTVVLAENPVVPSVNIALAKIFEKRVVIFQGIWLPL